MTFRHKRNITSYAYDAAVGNEIFVALSDFVVEAHVVLAAQKGADDPANDAKPARAVRRSLR